VALELKLIKLVSSADAGLRLSTGLEILHRRCRPVLPGCHDKRAEVESPEDVLNMSLVAAI
jgi:hypothetical protein